MANLGVLGASVALGAGVTLIGFTAFAQSKDGAAAQALFDEAKTLMAHGKSLEACPKLEESQRLDPGSGTLINLAKCYEETGRVASAWSSYLEAAAAAKTAGNANREAQARKRATALAPRVSKLTVNVPAEARIAGLEVTRDGETVNSPQWGLAIPEDEGEHAVVATAPGHTDWKAVATVKGEGTTTEISVPVLVLVEAPKAAPPEPPPTAVVRAPSPMPLSSGLGAQRILALGAGGVGVVGFAIGTVFGLKMISRHSDAEKYCSGTGCTDPRGVTAGNDAHSAGNVATIGMLVGAVGVAGGLTLWFTAPRERPGTEVSLGLGTVQLEGAF